MLRDVQNQYGSNLPTPFFLDFEKPHGFHAYALLSDQGTFTPVSAQGGFHGTPPEKTTFPPEFCSEICTIYVRVIKNHNSAKIFF